MAEQESDFVTRIGEMISYFMDLRGLPESDCHALSAAVKEEIRKEFQGERVTVRRLEADTIATRRAVRKCRDDGVCVDVIMQRFGISRATVYRYLK